MRDFADFYGDFVSRWSDPEWVGRLYDEKVRDNPVLATKVTREQYVAANLIEGCE